MLLSLCVGVLCVGVLCLTSTCFVMQYYVSFLVLQSSDYYLIRDSFSIS